MSTSSARLEVVAGNASGMSILVEDELLIGRQALGAGQLANDEEISRSHARVTVDASGFCAVEDLQSTNGTFVNGLRLSGPQTLSVGDTIELGQTTLVVRELPNVAAPPETSSERLQPTIVPRREPSPPSSDGLEPPEALAAAPPSAVAGDASAPPPPTLSLQLEVDYVNREARLSFGDSLEPVRLVFEAGGWRSITEPSDLE